MTDLQTLQHTLDDLELPEDSDQDMTTLKYFEKRYFDDDFSASEQDSEPEWLQHQMNNLYEDGEYLTSLQVEPSFELSDFHKSKTAEKTNGEEDGSDRSTVGKNDSQEATYASEFYAQPEALQLRIYAADIVTLQDQNAVLQKKLQKEIEAHAKYKKESELKDYEIKRISKERDTALGEKYLLTTQMAKLEARLQSKVTELETVKKLHEELKLKEKEPAFSYVDQKTLEETLVNVKFQLAQNLSEYEDMKFKMREVMDENKALKEGSQVQREQLRLYVSLLTKKGVGLSSTEAKI